LSNDLRDESAVQVFCASLSASRRDDIHPSRR
jgi:hypothetical protein